jgi:hypothetical protein
MIKLVDALQGDVLPAWTPTEVRDHLVREWGDDPSRSVAVLDVRGEPVHMVFGPSLEAARRVVSALDEDRLPSFIRTPAGYSRIKHYWADRLVYFAQATASRLRPLSEHEEVNGEVVEIGFDRFEQLDEPVGSMLWDEDEITGCDIDQAYRGQTILVPTAAAREWARQQEKPTAIEAIQTDDQPVAGKTNKLPEWHSLLRDLYLREDERDANYRLEHPARTPKPFPKSPWFRAQLIALKVPESKLRASTVRGWVARLNKEHGR